MRPESKDFRMADDAGEVGMGQTVEDCIGSKNSSYPQTRKTTEGLFQGSVTSFNFSVSLFLFIYILGTCVCYK